MIKCELTSQIVELAPGGSTAVVLTLTNQSEIIDDFQVSFQPVFTPETVGMNPAWLTLAPVQFTLRPILAGRSAVMDESQRAVRLNLKLPTDVEAGSYAGMIIVTAKSGPGNSAQVPFNLVVSENSQQELQLLPKEQTSRRRVEIYRVNLVNRGNSPHTYAVYAEDDQDECLFDVRPSEVTLLPREEAAFTLRVRPRRRNWTDDDQRYNFQVKLEGHDSYQPGLFVQRCSLPPVRWLQQHWLQIGFIFAFLLALVVAAFIFLLPLFANNVKAAFCGPISERYVAVTSDNLNTLIRVSGRGGSEADQVRFQVRADTMPGVFSSLISISPDGRRLAYVTARNLAMDDAHIIIVNLLSYDPVRGPALITDLAVPSGMWPTAPVWSSDGQRIAFFKRPDKPAQADAATTVAATTANSTTAGSPNASGAAGTTQAATTVAATTVTSTTPGASLSNVPGQLELWVAEAEAGKDPPKKLASPNRLTTNLFYGLGNHSPDGAVVCWATDNQSVLVRPRPDDKTTSKQVQVALADGKAEEISLKPAVPFIALPTVGAIQALPKAAFLLPVASLVPPPPVQAKPSPGPTGTANAAPKTSQALPPANPSTCPITKVFSQNDPQWSSQFLKSGNASKLGEWGCPIVAGAILLGYQGQDTTPAGLNTCLGELGYSLPLNDPGWTAVGQQCGGSQLLNGVRGDFDWGKLDNALANGPAIVGLIGGPSGLHFVVVTSGHDGQATTYGAVDPWDGTTDKTLDDFIGWGYRPRWLISYDQGGGKGCGTATEADLSHRPAGLGDLRATGSQVQITVNGPADGIMYNDQQNFQYLVTGASSASAIISLTAHTNGSTTPLRQPLPSDVLPLTDEGVYTVLIQARDKDGGLLATRHLYFTIDRTLPKIVPSLSPPPADQVNLRSDKPVKLQLAAADSLTGIATIKYQVNSGQWQTYSSDTATEPQTFDKQGTYNIAYYAVDGAGNATAPTFFNFSVAPPGAFVPGANQLTPGSFQSALTPLPSLPRAGTPNAGQGNNSLTLPTIAPVPTATPKPAVRATLPPVVVGTTPASVVITTEAAVVPTLAPLPTIQSLTPVASPTSQITLTPIATLTSAPTATPAPVTNLSFSTTQLTFESGVTSQLFKITNNGTVATTWTLTPSDSSGLLNFSVTTGYLAPGETATITISTVAANQGAQSQTTAFQVSPGGLAPQVINVTIKPKPLPSAVLNTSIVSGDTLPMSVTVGVTISASSLTQIADHSVITATYKTCDTCQPTSNPVGRLAALGNPTLVWDTSAILPQSGIQLGGLICASTDETNCGDITPITNLKIGLGATFLFPAASQLLTDTVTIRMQPDGRTKRIILSYTTADGNGQQTFLPDATATNNFQVSWNTLSIAPDLQPFSTANPVTLSARACNSTEVTAFCQDITPLTGLFTKMTATARAKNPDNTPLTANAVLSGTLSIEASNFSVNVNHVTALATYRDTGAATATPHNVARVSNNGTAAWDTSTIAAQNGIVLQLLDCYRADETWCDQIIAYNGLQIPVGAAVSLTAPEPFQSAVINQQFTNPLRIIAQDAKGNPVPGVQVTFTAPAFTVTSTNASGTFRSNGSTTEVVTTDGTGTATSSFFTANGNSGLYNVSASAPGIGTPATIQLTNNLPNQSQILIQNGDLQQAKITTVYTIPLQVKAVNQSGAPIQGANLTFDAQNTGSNPSGTFSNNTSTISVTTDVDGFASASLTANTHIGKFQVQVSGTGFNPTIFSLQNLKGNPATITVLSSYQNTAKGLYPFGATNTTPSFQATVKDAGGNPLDSIPVKFSAPNTFIAASGTFTNPIPAPPSTPSGATSATITSDANGIALSPPFFANLKLGSYNVTVQAGAVTTASQINLTNDPGDPSQVTFDTMPPGPLQLKTKQTVTGVFTATVYDLGANLVPNASVTFSVTTSSNGASGTFANNPATATSNASGLAVLNVGYTPNCFISSNYQLGATAASSISVQPGSYTLSNIVGGAAKITINGNNATQNNTVGSPTPYTPFNVTVTDGCGSPNNPVNGASLTFDVPNTTIQPSGTFAGGVSSVSATSAPDGTAIVSGLLPNTKAGQFNLTVTLIGGSQPATAIYTLTNKPDVPATITPSATTLSANVDQQFAGAGTPLSAIVTDQFGNPVPNTSVVFSTPDPTTTPATATFGNSFKNGTTTHILTVTTDAAGKASAGALFASKNAGTYNLTITAGGATTTVAMTNNAGPPDHFVLTPPGTPTYNTTVNTAFTSANFNVRVEDVNNNPVAGANVTYTAPATGASADFRVSTCTGAANPTFNATSNGSGNVTVTSIVCANAKSGSYTLQVTSGAATAFNFNLTNKPGTPDHFSPTTNSLAVTVGTAFNSTSLKVQVQDAGNNPVPGANVTYTVLPAGGAGADFGSCGSGTATNTATSNASGDVTPTSNLCANTVAGAYTLNITGAANPASFNLTNNADKPSVVTISPSSFNLAVATGFPNVTITVKDQFGNPVPGATASFQTSGNTNGADVVIGGTPPAVSDATGTITVLSTSGYLKANSKAGTYSLNAKATVGANSASTNPDPLVTQTAGVPQNIAANPAVNTTATVGTAYSPATLSVKVTDQFGNNVADGTNVTFTAPSSGASGTFGGSATTTVATSGGVATTGGSFTANNVVGKYEVTASAGAAASPALSFVYINKANLAVNYNANSATNRNTIAGDTVPLEVQVVDGGGTVVTGGTVTFAVGAATDGQFSNNAQSINVVNSSGTVSTNFTTGSHIGQIQATITLNIATGVTVQKTFNIYNGANIAITSGNNQTILVNGDTSAALSVQVTGNGTFGVGIPGVTVNYSVTSANGTVASATATTDGTGNASTTFTSNNGSGSIGNANVDASVTVSSSLKSLQTFNLTNSFNLSINAGDAQTAPNGTTFTNTLAIKAVGLGNTPVQGLSASFAVQGGATVGHFKQNTTNLGANATKNTNASGIADLNNAPAGRVDLVAGSTAGPLQVIATITQNGVTQTVTFNEIVT